MNTNEYYDSLGVLHSHHSNNRTITEQQSTIPGKNNSTPMQLVNAFDLRNYKSPEGLLLDIQENKQ